MVLVQVEYDGYTRQFKLIDREKAHALVDGERYTLLVDISVQDLVAEETSAGTETVIA